MNILDLIKEIKNAGSDATINITINNFSTDDVDIDDAVDTSDDLPYTDFEVGQAVLVCHIRKDGERVHTMGTVDTVLGQDERGWYTRVTANNGKHYRAGLTYGEERLGTVIYKIED